VAALVLVALLADPVADLRAEVERLAGDPGAQERREEAIRALGSAGTLASTRALEALLEDPYLHLRDAATGALGMLRAAADRRESLAFLGDTLRRRRNPETRARLASAIGAAGDPAGVPLLLAALPAEHDAPVVEALAAALAALGDEAAVEPLLQKASASPPGRAACLRALASFPNTAEACLPYAADPADAVRAAFVDVCAARRRPILPELEGSDRLGPLQAIALADALGATVPRDLALRRAGELLAHPSWRVRAAALDAVVARRDAALLSDLVDRLEGETGRIRRDAWIALRRLTGKEIAADPALWRKALPVSELAADAAAAPPPWDGPVFFGLPVASERAAFVLDASDAMREEGRAALLRDALRGTLGALAPAQRCDLVLCRFPRVHPPRPSVQRAFGTLRSGGAADALRWLAQVPPDGANALFDALAAAMADEEVDTIYVVAAGAPDRGTLTRRARILEEVAARNRWRRIAIHAVWLGGGTPDRELFRDLAAAAGGSSVDAAGRPLE